MRIEVVSMVHEAATTWGEKLMSYRMRFLAPTRYLRVSTESQKPDLQADGMRRYAAQADLEIVTQYFDVAVSGRKEGHPQLQALMRAARNHEFDCVLVWKFDRFARSVAPLLRALEEFNHLGIRFISVQDSIDTQSPMGRAMFTTLGAMAELESSSISERVKAGMEAARSRGQAIWSSGYPSICGRSYRRDGSNYGHEYPSHPW
ncbi:MAG: recombinase family protein [Candidatus Tectomicrobia bacterium]